ncbi:hypothetical protein ACMD2_13479 [Ananas comosus]|uniref:Uncharacterized protein n=1 Tax=Ananas comosus TaxID=4615 RepID=A0A199UT75_ANACO|nr:hypothetical protein ACMD2_13479 [Ananas comosus]
MASTFVRSVARISSSSIRSRVSNASSAAARPFSLPAPSPSTSASSRIRRVAFVSRHMNLLLLERNIGAAQNLQV